MAVEINVKNLNASGAWVDLFRGFPPVSYPGIIIETGNIDIPAEGDSMIAAKTDIVLTYDDVVKAINACPMDIGDIVIESSTEIKDINSLNCGLKVVIYNAEGTVMVHKFTFDIDLYQWSEYASHVHVEKGIQLAGNVFVRVYIPGHSKMRFMFYAPHDKEHNFILKRISTTNEPLKML